MTGRIRSSEQFANHGRERGKDCRPRSSPIEDRERNLQHIENNGYNMENNYAPGNKYLARMFAAMNLLASAFHTACDWLETFWQQAKRVGR